jgi:hypothetical protein
MLLELGIFYLIETLALGQMPWDFLSDFLAKGLMSMPERQSVEKYLYRSF